MEAHLTNSSLATVTNTASVINNTELQKAWHLVALLVRLGRPARPVELASLCALFRAPPDFVEYLCSIPNSPLFLTPDWFVTPSLVAFVTFGKFVLNLDVIGVFVPRFGLGGFGPKRVWGDVVRTYYRRRKRMRSEFECPPIAKKRAVLRFVDESEENQILLLSSCGNPSDFTKVYFDLGDCMTKRMEAQPDDISIMKLESNNLSTVVGKAPFSVSRKTGLLSYGLKNIEHESSMETSIFDHMKEHRYVYTPECQHYFLNFENFSYIPHPIMVEEIKACRPHSELSLLTTTIENPVVWREARMGEISFGTRKSFNATSCLEIEEQSIIPPVEAENVGHACKVKIIRTVEDKSVVDGKEKETLIDSFCHEGGIECIVPTINTAQNVTSPDTKRMNVVRCIDMIPPLDGEKTTAHVESKAVVSAAEPSLCQKQLMKSSAKSKTSQKDALNPKQQALCMALGNSKAVGFHMEQLQCTREKNSISVKQKLKQICDKPIAIDLNNQQEPKPLPNFESFTIEEEEGSGGYGTVYKAQRKNDRVTFAIKCPHANANKHHVHNELKMLERFGGKNFVIKYEGSFKSGNSECLVLEHVEHDRPEVLKREIDVFQLQWYGYCMFRALAVLHKQGIVHRDVKPGNFLFSRNTNKGYLIDFNLALDLHQKYGTIDKSKVGYDASFNHVPPAHTKSLPPTNQKFLASQSLEAMNKHTGQRSKPLLFPKNLKKKAVDQTNGFSDLGSRNVMKSQGADGSGITSAKDATSNITPSAERLREPIPCQGRKELISLVHKAMQGPNYEGQSVPVSKRKRIVALPGKVDRKLVYLTPMPLHSAGITVAGAGLLKNKGDGKQKREGPCVGTKGFRAPEVLFRSPHQGPKVDIWSAGVTLLYLMIGRTPFAGEPEQNIKEIAKLRGSEDLWEVAKLHNRESSFPVDLFDVKFLPSTKLRDWCKQNTKRPEFFEAIPRSLFDLVEKCLTVNPRLRISAEEALRHEFFAPCHEGLRKERLHRKGHSLDSGTTHLLHRHSQPCEGISIV